MAGALPAVEQRITVQTAGYLAALDQVLAAIREFLPEESEPGS